MTVPVIAVTGGIASGKSTVAEVLSARGGKVVNCDTLAHRVYHFESLKDALLSEFGRDIFDDKNEISRCRLGKVVFSNKKRLKKLNEMVKPYVKRIIDEEVLRLMEDFRYLVLDAVLFFEYKFKFNIDLIVVTEASEGERMKRLVERDRFSKEEAERRIASQRSYYSVWSKVEMKINTEVALDKVKKLASEIRDEFLNDSFQRGGTNK